MLVVVAAVSGAAASSSCGGRVDDPAEPSGDAGPSREDAAAKDAAPPATTSKPTRCPVNPPIRGVACFRGDVCEYCPAGAATGVRATCPSGTWVLETLGPCGG